MSKLAIAICLLTSPALAADLVDPRVNIGQNAKQMVALHNAIQTACGCAVDGVAVITPKSLTAPPPNGVRIDYNSADTPDQIAKGNAALKTFVFPDPEE